MNRTLLLVVLAGCVKPESVMDAGLPDAGVSDAGVDGGAVDSGVPDGGPVDAGESDAGNCPAVCDSCIDGECYVVARDGGATCPPGMACDLTWVSGHGPLDCSAATDCRISAGGRSPVLCGSGHCTVTCGGFGTCGDVD